MNEYRGPSRPGLCLLILLLAAALASCGRAVLSSEPTPAPVETQPPAPTAAAPTPAPTPEPTPTPTPEPTPEPTPVPSAEQALLSIDDEALSRALLDDSFQSFATLSADSELVIRADRPVAGLYLVWNDHPLPCEIWTEAGTVSVGGEGFLHEWVSLPAAAQELRLRLPEQDVALCDVYGFTPGYPPAWVQQWEPPWETADVLLFSAHADDEYIFFGGIIPGYGAGRGMAVQVVYMTSPYIGSERFRCHELLNGLWTAGQTHYPVTSGYRDLYVDNLYEALNTFGADAFQSYQVEQIRRFRPLVVVSHDLNGEYGHGAHCLTAHALLDAVPAAADPAQYPDSAARYGAWDTPKLYLHLYGDEPAVLDYETPLEAFGGRTAYEVAAEAYAQHLSQQQWAFHVYSFDSPLDSHRFGLVRSLVGEDEEKNDLLEHVDPAAFR